MKNSVNQFTHISRTGSAKMVNVANKQITLRYAVAEGKVLLNSSTMEAVKNNNLPKGNIFETSRIAGIMAAKRTSDIIPLCHNIPIEGIDIYFELMDNKILIRSEVYARARTGAEMEAIVSVLIAAATLYDMLKALQKDIIITDVILIEKKGGKSGQYKWKGKNINEK